MASSFNRFSALAALGASTAAGCRVDFALIDLSPENLCLNSLCKIHVAAFGLEGTFCCTTEVRDSAGQDDTCISLVRHNKAFTDRDRRIVTNPIRGTQALGCTNRDGLSMPL